MFSGFASLRSTDLFDSGQRWTYTENWPGPICSYDAFTLWSIIAAPRQPKPQYTGVPHHGMMWPAQREQCHLYLYTPAPAFPPTPCGFCSARHHIAPVILWQSLWHTCSPLGPNAPSFFMYKHFYFVSMSQIRHHLCPNRVEFIMLLALWLITITSLCKTFGLFYYFPLLSLGHIHSLTVPAQAPSLVDYGFNSWTIHSVLVHECIINVHKWYYVEI